MNVRMIGRILAQIIAIEMVFLLPALGISLGYGEIHSVQAFLLTLAVMALSAGILWLICRKASKQIGASEGMISVGFGWIALSLFGCLPFFFSREIPSFVDAFFETVSGFTTTGASVVANVEGLSKGILYWRSFTNWLGGMGVLVFLLAIAPTDGSGFTMHLLRAESPGPNVGKLVPKMKKTATILYLIYVAPPFPPQARAVLAFGMTPLPLSPPISKMLRQSSCSSLVSTSVVSICSFWAISRLFLRMKNCGCIWQLPLPSS